MEKKWYLSKTFWVNGLAIIALIAQGQFGFVIGPEIQVALLGFINLVLRLATKTEIVWK